jgi:hypothetical protein
MNIGIFRTNRLLDTPLDRGPRVLLILAILMIAASFVAPLWTVAVSSAAGTSRSGVGVYSVNLAGAVTSSVVVAADPPPASLPRSEPMWIAFGLTAAALLFARAAALGTLRSLVDSLVAYLLFGWAMLWLLSRDLARFGGTPEVPGPTRLLFGGWQNAELKFSSGPAAGAWALVIVALLLGGALAMAWRSAREELASDFAIVAG